MAVPLTVWVRRRHSWPTDRRLLGGAFEARNRPRPAVGSRVRRRWSGEGP